MKLPFQSIHSCLTWYFNRGWVRPPKDVSSISWIKTQAAPIVDDAGQVIQATVAIEQSLKELSPREQFVLMEEYYQKKRNQGEIAEECGLAGERSVRDVRDRALNKLEPLLCEKHVVSKIIPEEPVYAE